MIIAALQLSLSVQAVMIALLKMCPGNDFCFTFCPGCDNCLTFIMSRLSLLLYLNCVLAVMIALLKFCPGYDYCFTLCPGCDDYFV